LTGTDVTALEAADGAGWFEQMSPEGVRARNPADPGLDTKMSQHRRFLKRDGLEQGQVGFARWRDFLHKAID